MPKRTFQPNRRHRVKDTRVPGAHEDQGRRCRVEPPPCHRPQARFSQRRLPRLSASLPFSPPFLFAPECAARQRPIPDRALTGNAMNSPAKLQACRACRAPIDGGGAFAQARRLSARLCGRPQEAIRIDELVSGAAITRGASAAGPRIGLTAGKVLGKAHERNRIKRRMREALRRHVELLPGGFDLIFHPRRMVLTMEFAKLEAEIVRILQQAKAEAARSAQRSAPAAARQRRSPHHDAHPARAARLLSPLALAGAAFAGHGRMPLSAHMLGVCCGGNRHARPAARHRRWLSGGCCAAIRLRRGGLDPVSQPGDASDVSTQDLFPTNHYHRKSGGLTGCPLELTGRILCPKFTIPIFRRRVPAAVAAAAICARPSPSRC